MKNSNESIHQLKRKLYPAKRFIKHLGYRTRSRLLAGRGNAVYCPCCGLYFPHFTVFEYAAFPQRYCTQRYLDMPQEVVCPMCLSLPRHRILVDRLSQREELWQGKRILYFAPEQGTARWLRRQKADVVTADLFEKADLRLDLMETGLPAGFAGLLICCHVLEHVPDYKKALAEIHRLIGEEGTAILAFPIDPQLEKPVEADGAMSTAERVRRFGQDDHLRIFGRNARQLLEEAGFAVETVCGDDCPPEIVPVVGPADYDSNVLFLCRQKKEGGA